MTRLYCPECSEYLEGGDGECHDCSCGWKQPVETFEDEASTLQVAYDELCEELEDSQRQLEVAAEFCRQYQIESKALSVENTQLKASTADCYEKNLDLNLENFELKAKNNHLQFLLDSVMLEHCPSEMTHEQIDNWQKAQRAVDTADPLYYKLDTYKNNVKFSVDMIK